MLNRLWFKFTSWRYILPSINTLSFYRSKMILDHPNCFGWLQIVLVGSNPFWSGPNHFGQVQIRLFWTNFYSLDLSKMIWNWPKQIGPGQNDWYWTKMIWTVQNHFGPIEGQGIRIFILMIKHISLLIPWKQKISYPQNDSAK